MIRESEIFISVICDPLFFPFVNRARDPPCTTLLKSLLANFELYLIVQRAWQVFNGSFVKATRIFIRLDSSVENLHVTTLISFLQFFLNTLKDIYISFPRSTSNAQNIYLRPSCQTQPLNEPRYVILKYLKILLSFSRFRYDNI